MNNWNRPRCLIAEDNLICRMLINGFLKNSYECDFAANGHEAYELYRLSHENKKPYNLICLDIAMPQVDGLEALRRIRRYEQDSAVPPSMEVKTIIVSANSSPSAVFEAMYRCGAQGYVVKPVNAGSLSNQLVQVGLPAVSNQHGVQSGITAGHQTCKSPQ